MDHVNDQNALYRDGGLGGAINASKNGSLTGSSRIQAGYEQGVIDAEFIIQNLARDKSGSITESIKVVTHSMGAAYAKGYQSNSGLCESE